MKQQKNELREILNRFLFIAETKPLSLEDYLDTEKRIWKLAKKEVEKYIVMKAGGKGYFKK